MMPNKGKDLQSICTPVVMDAHRPCIGLPHTLLTKHIGISWKDVSSWKNFVHLSAKRVDGSSLAVFRFLFGCLMVVDVFFERGLSTAEVRWGDDTECRFPLLQSLQPLPLEWMYVIYFIMMNAAIMLAVGFCCNCACVTYFLCYLYIFLLDKTSWNNHSYLYALIFLLLSVSNCNACLSIDAWFGGKGLWSDSNGVPLWNYALLRIQIFLVYTIAGLKKTNIDWVQGYSVAKLSQHSIFNPFRIFLNDDQIDLFIIHYGGLLLDAFGGIGLFFDNTRWLTVFLLSSFHVMNAQIFSIGMFPFVMLAASALFFPFNWPRMVFRERENVCEDKNRAVNSERVTFYQHIVACCCVFYVALQLFLPYSHSITKGYNTWTNGLYGYSWDMMVHSWELQHINVWYTHDDFPEEIRHLDPFFWAPSSRWYSHADMIKQYAECVSSNLRQSHHITNISLHVDVWMGLNDRFKQRMFDPRVNMVDVDWNAFTAAAWVMPLMWDLSDWRHTIKELEDQAFTVSNYSDLVCVADFPGMHLDNYISADFQLANITILEGKVLVETLHESRTLAAGGSMLLPHSQFHSVSTISTTPACYCYMYINVTEQALGRQNQGISSKTMQTCDGAESQNLKNSTAIFLEPFLKSFFMMSKAFQSIYNGQKMAELFNVSSDTNFRDGFDWHSFT